MIEPMNPYEVLGQLYETMAKPHPDHYPTNEAFKAAMIAYRRAFICMYLGLSEDVVGSDPTKDEEPSLPKSIERLQKAVDKQQCCVPDQMALIWRLDLLRLLGQYAHRDAFYQMMKDRVEAVSADHLAEALWRATLMREGRMLASHAWAEASEATKAEWLAHARTVMSIIERPMQALQVRLKIWEQAWRILPWERLRRFAHKHGGPAGPDVVRFALDHAERAAELAAAEADSA